MTFQQIPNVRVWSHGREYVEAAEILLDYNRVGPAAVIAALAVEIFLKSFLAKRLPTGHATIAFTTHDIPKLYKELPPTTRSDLVACSSEIDPNIDFEQQLLKQDGIFTGARYRYEPTASPSVGSDSVYFARHLCETVFLFGKKRGV